MLSDILCDGLDQLSVEARDLILMFGFVTYSHEWVSILRLKVLHAIIWGLLGPAQLPMLFNFGLDSGEATEARRIEGF